MTTLFILFFEENHTIFRKSSKILGRLDKTSRCIFSENKLSYSKKTAYTFLTNTFKY